MQARFAPFAPLQGADQCASSQRGDKGEHFPPDRDKITAHYRLHSARRKENLLHIDTADQQWLSTAAAGLLVDWRWVGWGGGAVEERGFPVQTLMGHIDCI